MKKLLYTFIVCMLLGGFQTDVYAGNPDRQGEAGAYELLMIPYARTAGFHGLSTANVSGVEAIRLNPAGLATKGRTEFTVGHARYLEGTGINMNALGLSQKIGKGGGTFGFSLMSLSFGDIAVTTTDQPEGTGVYFSPTFFNLGVSYAHTFENKVSVGLTVRSISESTADLTAFGFALDAGVQYVSGDMDQFKLGISLRNVGTKMRFGGEGLNTIKDLGSYQLTVSERSAAFDLPTNLNIGMSYDFLFGSGMRLTALGSFISNSYSTDDIGLGMEFSLRDRFMVRAAYRTPLEALSEEEEPIYSGLSAGASFGLVTGKNDDGSAKSRLSIDYGYRQTKLWQGTHNLGLRYSF